MNEYKGKKLSEERQLRMTKKKVKRKLKDKENNADNDSRENLEGNLVKNIVLEANVAAEDFENSKSENENILDEKEVKSDVITKDDDNFIGPKLSKLMSKAEVE